MSCMINVFGSWKPIFNHNWFKLHAASDQLRETYELGTSKKSTFSLIVWTLKAMYGVLSYYVHELLNDPHPRSLWVPKPYTTTSIHMFSKLLQIVGSLRHKICRKISISCQPFDNLTCSMYLTILQENDFRKTGECYLVSSEQWAVSGEQ
jgi:hypothetical protein